MKVGKSRRWFGVWVWGKWLWSGFRVTYAKLQNDAVLFRATHQSNSYHVISTLSFHLLTPRVLFFIFPTKSQFHSPLFFFINNFSPLHHLFLLLHNPFFLHHKSLSLLFFFLFALVLVLAHSLVILSIFLFAFSSSLLFFFCFSLVSSLICLPFVVVGERFSKLP